MFKKIIILFCSFFISGIIYADKGKFLKPPLQTIIIDPGHGGIDVGAAGAVSTEAKNALAISLRVRELLEGELPDVKVLMTREKDELPGGFSNINESLRWRANFANQNKGDLFVAIHLNSTNVKYDHRIEGYRTETYYVYKGKGKHKKKIAKTKQVPIIVKYRSPNQVTGTQTYIWAANSKVSDTKIRVVAASDQVYGERSNDMDSSFDADLASIEAKIRAQQYTKYFFQKSKNLAQLVEDEFSRVGRKSWGVMQRNEKAIWVLQATAMPSILVETGFISDLEEEKYLHSEKGQEEIAHCIVNAIKAYKDQLEANQKHAIANQNAGK